MPVLQVSTVEAQRAATQHARRGRASLLVFVVLLALAALLAILFATLVGQRDRTEPARQQAGPAGPTPVERGPASLAPRYQVGDAQPSAPLTERPPLDQRPSFPAEQRFAGQGRIQGHLSLPEGTAPPPAWTLVLEPSRALIGGDRARPQRVQFTAGEREFDLPDIPLGGYEIWAEAPGMSGRHEHLLLARPDAQLVYQGVLLRTCAYVEGRVLDRQQRAYSDLAVLLAPLAGGEPLETRCDSSGHYLFESVPDGEYRMLLGFADAPLGAPRELSVEPPSLHMPLLEVPELFPLELRVSSPEGGAVEGALVRGWCSNGGRLSVVTDGLGTARVAWMPAGRLTLEALLPERPRDGHARIKLEFPPPPPGIVEMQLER